MTVLHATLDLLTRCWWRLVGRPIDLSGRERWLSAPTSATSQVDDEEWLTTWAATLGGRVVADEPGAGLIPSMDALASPDFDPARLPGPIRDFYEHTSDWHLELWTEWTPWFWPGGELISRLFGKRVQQLALPMRALDVSRGMDSGVTLIRDAEGRQQTAGWIRRLRSNGDKVFSGAYQISELPGVEGARVHVSFPLESGNVQVFLRPRLDPDGSMWLLSPAGRFGQDGAYVVVTFGRRSFAARIPLHESFHLYVDDDGVLRTDHALMLFRFTAVRLHYKLTRPDGRTEKNPS